MARSALRTALFMTLAVHAIAQSKITVTVKNPLNIARSSETVVLPANDLRQALSVDDMRRVHVRGTGSSQDSLIQAVDLDGDGRFDQLLFQTDIGPSETQTFTLTVGAKQIADRDQFKAYGRFVRERLDDFAWENDRIAHRMYGKALETWKAEPLTSSAVDVWSKRTSRLVINDWYMVDDYHRDHGEGADLYSSGPTRGCGGNGIWTNDKLYPSANFVNSRVIANGPIRVLFELTYPAWDVNGVQVSETKRISLDAGQNFDRFESHYTFSGPTQLESAVGIKKTRDSKSEVSRKDGTLRTWEPLKEGQLGCAIILDPSTVLNNATDNLNYYLTQKIGNDKTTVYYAGFGWTSSGHFKDVEDWDHYVAEFVQRLRAPLVVTIPQTASENRTRKTLRAAGQSRNAPPNRVPNP
ncbi:MAG TPA: DUF4861 domain-containing protein [Terriglobales bacterium]|nr:DUF4861 domain-containing protein [Terriglobales bacterium]